MVQQAERLRDRHELRHGIGGQRQVSAAVPAELLRNPERMERAEPVAELEQRLVVYREERPFQ
jgi:hypothetical protein